MGSTHGLPAEVRNVRRRRAAAAAVALATAFALGAGATWATGGGAAQADTDEPAVLEPVGRDSGPEQDPAQVAARLAPLTGVKKLGKQAATLVVDAESGRTLYDDDGSLPLMPASTNKIPTSVAALLLAGGDRRLTTSVTLQGGDLFLVGGGDPLLVSRAPQRQPGYPVYPAPTPLKKLVADTAAALRGRQVTAVSLKVDDSFFEGPAWQPSWPEYYRTEGIVAPISALIVDDGRVGGTAWAPISPDPAVAAGTVFAQLLRKQGIKVRGVARGRSGGGAAEVAAIQSAPVSELVQQTLSTSDNQTAENLFRIAARYGGFPASFAGGGQAVAKALADLGVSTAMTTFSDGSGLSREDRLTANLLTDVLRAAMSGEDQGLWPVPSGLAVAGVNGTLRGRFAAPTTSSAAGWLRAKTGTLNYVSSLAGYVQSRSGRVLVFASIANDAKSSYEAAGQIDVITAAVADCGCPGDER